MNDTLVSSGTILVVEDDEGIQFTLRELLSYSGYRVETAGHGKEALEVLSRIERPCLILLDLFMPVMDGWQFLNQLKTEGRENLEQIPIVLLTAAGNKASDAAKQTQGLITKPIDLETLLSTVKKYCVSTQ